MSGYPACGISKIARPVRACAAPGRGCAATPRGCRSNGDWAFRLSDACRRAGGLRRARLRRRGLGPAAGAVALAAARLRRAGLHERALPVPGRPAVRARREPDGRLPAPLRRARGLGRRRGGAALRGRRLVRCACGSTATTSGRRAGSRLPAEFDVGALLRPGGENVLAVRVHQWSSGSLPRGPGHVVAVGDLPRRRRCSRGPAGAIDDVFVHADYDHVTGAGHAARGRARRRRAGDGAGARDRRRGAARPVAVERVEPWSAEVPRLYDGGRGERGRARAAAGRLPPRGRSRTGCCWSTGTACSCTASTATSSIPTRGRAVVRGGDAARHRADEGAQRQRGAHVATTRRTRASSSCATSSGCT